MPQDKKTILIAEDDAAITTVLKHALTEEGFEVMETDSLLTLQEWAKNGAGNVVITDVMMPDGNGLEILPAIQEAREDLKIIVISAHNTLHTALQANKQGAFEYLPKPFDLNKLIGLVKSAVEETEYEASAVNNDATIEKALSAEEKVSLIGRSQVMQNIYKTIARVTATNLNVMINGESGTGKELIAKIIHDNSPRSPQPFIAVNMAAIPQDLIESELFGHEKGSFTGALNKKTGRFEQADGGTLFLDEIGDMPFDAQTKLLRVLQEGEFSPVGSHNSIKTDVRIIAATNKNLKQMIAEGRFREDLFYRLNVVPIEAPPLRDRKEDIPELTEHFLQKAYKKGLPLKKISKDALEYMKKHNWAGNIRELENLINRLCALCSTETISFEDVRDEIAPSDYEGLSACADKYIRIFFDAHDKDYLPTDVYHHIIREVEKPLIEIVLAETSGNQIKASDILGLNRNTLRKKINELNISVSSFKK